ncbi:MAG TPA: c-type cytochrome domain-containing protein, partial [Planctomycetaceae bacterium]|nr:c-type cytochrome domain-containing protein [Planctomycetaceae bacterium]
MSRTRKRSSGRSGIAALIALLLCGRCALADLENETLLFNRDIRPILSDVCFQCHGPDAKQRKVDLRLDRDEQLFVDREGHRILVPHDPLQSELFRRLITTDDDERMPPPSSGKRLSPRQIETLRRWIEQGAKWQPHWAFLTPSRPPLPPV